VIAQRHRGNELESGTVSTRSMCDFSKNITDSAYSTSVTAQIGFLPLNKPYNTENGLALFRGNNLFDDKRPVTGLQGNLRCDKLELDCTQDGVSMAQSPCPPERPFEVTRYSDVLSSITLLLPSFETSCSTARGTVRIDSVFISTPR